MKKIILKGISEILSEKEMKNVKGGSGTVGCLSACTAGQPCFFNGYKGTCLAPTISSSCVCYLYN